MSDANAIVVAGAIGAGAAVVASALTGYITYRVQSSAAKAQQERDSRNAGRHLRERKAERLRTAYSRVVAAADAIQYASKRGNFRLAGESEEQQHAEISRVLQEGTKGLPEAIHALRLETETPDVLDAWNHMYGEYVRLQTALASNRQMPGSTSWDEIRAFYDSVDAGLNRIIELARAHLAQYDRPL